MSEGCPSVASIYLLHPQTSPIGGNHAPSTQTKDPTLMEGGWNMVEHGSTYALLVTGSNPAACDLCMDFMKTVRLLVILQETCERFHASVAHSTRPRLPLNRPGRNTRPARQVRRPERGRTRDAGGRGADRKMRRSCPDTCGARRPGVGVLDPGSCGSCEVLDQASSGVRFIWQSHSEASC